LRILLLTPQMPYPPEQGTAIRNLALVREIAASHPVALLSFHHGAEPDTRVLSQCCERVVSVRVPARSRKDRLRTLFLSREPDMARRLLSKDYWSALRDLVTSWRPDVVQVEAIELAPYAFLLRDWLGDQCPTIIFDDHNAEYLLQKRAAATDSRRPARWSAALYSCIQWWRLRRYERRACAVASVVLCVSEADAEALRALVPGLEPVIVPNGVDVERYAHSDAAPLRHPALLFTGKMDYRPNVDAMDWFCRGVLPLVREAEPEVVLYVVGKDAKEPVRQLGELPGVVVTGYVPDITAYFAGADVFVAPLRVGGGTRLKILEAMAAGTALVSTRLGAEGIGLTDGEHALIADEEVVMAEAIVALLRDEALRDRLTTAARDFVTEHYDWSRIAPRMEAVYQSLMAGRQPSSPA
ncbi:MAG: glycosyltransferase, partial [Chloroflexi bacterium]|nr:glycosyltransferase [Chloroflexota bacterium]